MRLTEYIIINNIAIKFTKLLSESIFDDLHVLQNQILSKDVITGLAALLFYIKMHQGSSGNTDLKMFYTDASLNDKIDQFKPTILNNPLLYKQLRAEVIIKFKQKRGYEIYNSISRFFSQPQRLPKDFRLQS